MPAGPARTTIVIADRSGSEGAPISVSRAITIGRIAPAVIVMVPVVMAPIVGSIMPVTMVAGEAIGVVEMPSTEAHAASMETTAHMVATAATTSTEATCFGTRRGGYGRNANRAGGSDCNQELVHNVSFLLKAPLVWTVPGPIGRSRWTFKIYNYIQIFNVYIHTWCLQYNFKRSRRFICTKSLP